MKELPSYKNQYRILRTFIGEKSSKIVRIGFRWYIHNFKGFSEVCQTDLLHIQPPQILPSALPSLFPPVLSLFLNSGATHKSGNIQEKSKPHSEWAQPATPQTADVEKVGDQLGGNEARQNGAITLFTHALHVTLFGTKAMGAWILFQDLKLFPGISAKASWGDGTEAEA